MKYLIIALSLLATPALADEVGVHAGPVGAGVTVGQSPDYYRDHDRDRTTVIKEREPRETDRTTVIKKEHGDGTESKTVIHHDNDWAPSLLENGSDYVAPGICRRAADVGKPTFAADQIIRVDY
jgi:hypothetical protein